MPDDDSKPKDHPKRRGLSLAVAGVGFTVMSLIGGGNHKPIKHVSPLAPQDKHYAFFDVSVYAEKG